jgi:Ala-tRNA(Pro) deacylase
MKVLDFLDSNSARYEITEHRTTFSAQQMAAQEHVPGINVAKPVVVKADNDYLMCVLPACCKVDLDALKKQLAVSEVALADESEMAKMFTDCQLGAEPPFGKLYGLSTIMDKTLDEDEYIVFQGGTHERAIKMTLEEYKALAEPVILSFSYHSR